jgi:retron-type reverse transcriptase
MFNLLKEVIQDQRFLDILRKYVKAGYLKNGIKYVDLLGVPQGGVISGILSNIYLNKLDKYMKKLFEEEFKSNKEPLSKNCTLYRKEYYKIEKLQKQFRKEPSKEILKEILKLRRKLKGMPAKVRIGERLFYVRYVDDFIIGLVCTRQKAKLINQKIIDFLDKELKIQCGNKNEILSFRSQKVKFLGVYIFRGKGRKSNTESPIIRRHTKLKSGR